MKTMNFVLEEPVFKSMCSSSCITPRYNSFFFKFCQCWVFIAGRGLSPAAATGVGFSLSWLPLLWSTGEAMRASEVAARGLSGCGAWA